MRNSITIASMECSGIKTEEDRFKDPFIRIVLDPENQAHSKTEETLHYKLESIDDDLVFRVPITYREATKNLDHPNFKMTVLDESGRIIQLIEEKFSTDVALDIFGYFDQQDGVLQFRVPLETIKIGEPNTYKYHLETQLEQWEWKDRKLKGDQLETLVEEKDFTVTFEVEQVFGVTFGAFVTAGNWKDIYHVKARVWNRSESDITYELICTETDESGVQSNIPLDRVVRSQLQTAAAGIIAPGEWDFTSSAIKKDWEWWDGFMVVEGPLEKTFKYVVEFTLNEIQGINVNYTFPTQTRTKVVKVQEEKQSLANYANYCYEEYLIDTAAAIGFAVACALFCAPCCVAAVVAEAAALVWKALADDAKEEAKDPIEYDPKYNEISDYQREIEIIKIKDTVPLEIRSLIESLNKMRAQRKSIKTTYARYMSAVKEKDTKLASKQKTSAEGLLTLIEKEFMTFKKWLRELKEYESKAQIEIDKTKISKGLKKLREEGLTTSQKEELREKGVSDQDIAAIEEKTRKLKVTDIDFRMYPKYERLSQQAADIHFYTLETVQGIRRIDSLSNEDVQVELLKEGLISPKEFYEGRDKEGRESNYLITEIEEISDDYKENLANTGILTTSDLLKRASTDREITRLAKTTRINKKLIQKWVILVKLMRIKGVDEEYSEFLMKLGYKDLQKFAKEDPEKLYEKIRKDEELLEKGKRLPSKTQIKKWIQSAQQIEED